MMKFRQRPIAVHCQVTDNGEVRPDPGYEGDYMEADGFRGNARFVVLPEDGRAPAQVICTAGVLAEDDEMIIKPYMVPVVMDAQARCLYNWWNDTDPPGGFVDYRDTEDDGIEHSDNTDNAPHWAEYLNPFAGFTVWSEETASMMLSLMAHHMSDDGYGSVSQNVAAHEAKIRFRIQKAVPFAVHIEYTLVNRVGAYPASSSGCHFMSPPAETQDCEPDYLVYLNGFVTGSNYLRASSFIGWSGFVGPPGMADTTTVLTATIRAGFLVSDEIEFLVPTVDAPDLWALNFEETVLDNFTQVLP